MRFLWLTLADPVTGKKKMKKVMLLATKAKELTLELVKAIYADLHVIEFYETAEAGI